MADGVVEVTVIVPCRNEAGIRRFLDDVLSQRGITGSVEIIVADGMSTDGTWEILEEIAKSHGNLVVIKNEQRTVSYGLNAAIRRANGDVIVRLDVHARYAPDYVAECLAVLEETGAQK